MQAITLCRTLCCRSCGRFRSLTPRSSGSSASAKTRPRKIVDFFFPQSSRGAEAPTARRPTPKGTLQGISPGRDLPPWVAPWVRGPPSSAFAVGTPEREKKRSLLGPVALSSLTCPRRCENRVHGPSSTNIYKYLNSYGHLNIYSYLNVYRYLSIYRYPNIYRQLAKLLSLSRSKTRAQFRCGFFAARCGARGY